MLERRLLPRTLSPGTFVTRPRQAQRSSALLPCSPVFVPCALCPGPGALVSPRHQLKLLNPHPCPQRRPLLSRKEIHRNLVELPHPRMCRDRELHILVNG